MVAEVDSRALNTRRSASAWRSSVSNFVIRSPQVVACAARTGQTATRTRATIMLRARGEPIDLRISFSVLDQSNWTLKRRADCITRSSGLQWTNKVIPAAHGGRKRRNKCNQMIEGLFPSLAEGWGCPRAVETTTGGQGASRGKSASQENGRVPGTGTFRERGRRRTRQDQISRKALGPGETADHEIRTERRKPVSSAG